MAVPAPVGAAIIWFHGLGDTRVCYWERRFGASSLGAYFGNGGVRFLEPRAPPGRAPVQAVRNYGCKKSEKIKNSVVELALQEEAKETTVPSWFDIPVLPIGQQTDARDAGNGLGPSGLTASVEIAHGIAASLERDHGIPSHKILFGGFSQGGALAIEAGTTYERPCGGIVSISGWWPRRSSISRPSRTNTSTGKAAGDGMNDCQRVPIFFSSGTSDPVVLYSEAKASCEALIRAFSPGTVRSSVLHVCDVTCKKVQRGKHMPSSAELESCATWIMDRILAPVDEQ